MAVQQWKTIVSGEVELVDCDHIEGEGNGQFFIFWEGKWVPISCGSHGGTSVRLKLEPRCVPPE